MLVRVLSGVALLTFPSKRWALRHGGKDLEQLERTVRDRLLGAHQRAAQKQTLATDCIGSIRDVDRNLSISGAVIGHYLPGASLK
jgi:hypothetical protein